MNDRSDDAIKDLCTSYSAYVRAITGNDNNSIIAWSICLMGDQKRTGVSMVPMSRLEDTLKIRDDLTKEIY